MDFGLTPEQEQFRDGLRALLAHEATPKHVRAATERPQGYLPELWERCVELGICALGLPAPHGAGTAIDAAVAAFELGRVAAPVPFLESSVLPGLLVRHCVESPLRTQILDGLSRGRLIAVGLLATDCTWIGPSAPPVAVNGTGRVNGEAVLVRYPQVGGWVTIAGEEDGTVSLYHVPGDDGVIVVPRAGVDPTPLGDVRFVGAEAERLGPVSPTALHELRVVAAAWLSGAASRLVQLSVEYASERIQFGRPIGSFQALQHRMADMEVVAEGAWLLTQRAAVAVDRGTLDEARALGAWSFASESARRCAASAHQVFGGYGFTVDYDVHLYSRRVKALGLWLGDAARTAEQLGRSWRARAGLAPPAPNIYGDQPRW